MVYVKILFGFMIKQLTDGYVVDDGDNRYSTITVQVRGPYN